MGGRLVVSGRREQLALGKYVRRRRLLDVRGYLRSGLSVCGGAGWRDRASESVHARDSQPQAVAELWREETALQLEHADSHESERKGDDLYWGAVPVPLARSRAVVGSRLS